MTGPAVVGLVYRRFAVAWIGDTAPSLLSGYHHPDKDPCGPYGSITDEWCACTLEPCDRLTDRSNFDGWPAESGERLVKDTTMVAVALAWIQVAANV